MGRWNEGRAAAPLASALLMALGLGLGLGLGATLGCDVRSRASTPPIDTVAGDRVGGQPEGPGVPALATEIGEVCEVVVGPDGNVYFASLIEHRVRVWDRGADSVRTVAGNGLAGNGPDGPALEAAMGEPVGLAFDAAGRLLVADWSAPGDRVERIDLAAGTFENVAGSGFAGFVDDVPAAEAAFDHPSGVAVDASGTLYVADQFNNRVRVMGGDGAVHTYAGAGPGWGETDGLTGMYLVCDYTVWGGTIDCYTGDGGPAAEARLNLSWMLETPILGGRIALDGAGNLFVADSANNVVRRVERGTTTITTIAGVGHAAGSTGDGGPATEALLDWPTDVAIAADGAVYVADTFASCVRRIDPDGVITTVAGICGQTGYTGDGGPAVAALLDHPWGIDLDAAGDLYIADTGNRVIRRVNFP
jgi:sugar lactone lactonase YvrE